MKRVVGSYHPHEEEPYMNQCQLDYFEIQLRQWRTQLQQEAHEATREMREENVRAAELVEQSLSEYQRRMTLISHDRKSRLLAQIDAALLRIKDGSYGYCVETGEEIGLRRLLAYPAAFLLVEVQEAREHRSRSFANGVG
ncbi:TraR/DksA C4-type zinc finger protein [uncultured Desulfuromonas sp.]|uniref:TraR/DksA family transcriptional regulator n=1 Tax=uncultured Desulfuromonas sp. TaxID=181013 RepID=UPI002AAB8250|nr:TraR/DksA C4-type zinc finger protein [uncultured Desulfuromonas sp.]